MANESFFVDDHVRLTMQDIDQQVRRYLTACEREKASYRLVEEAFPNAAYTHLSWNTGRIP